MKNVYNVVLWLLADALSTLNKTEMGSFLTTAAFPNSAFKRNSDLEIVFGYLCYLVTLEIWHINKSKAKICAYNKEKPAYRLTTVCIITNNTQWQFPLALLEFLCLYECLLESCSRIQDAVPGCQRCEEDKIQNAGGRSEVPRFTLQGDGKTQTGQSVS